MLTVLVTGFEPFNNAKLNPSEQLALSLKPNDVPGAQILTKVLPVVYGQAAEQLLALVEEHKPDVVICFGLAEGRTGITPERFAVNMDDASIADNAGHLRTDQKIHPDGPVAFESTLPIKELVAAIRSEGIPAAVSLSAGTFVCNHIFYELQRALVQTEVQSGFVHVPLMTEMSEDFPNLFTMEIEKMVLAAKAMITTLVAKQ
jgi:pyroglutamyl-peptidase